MNLLILFISIIGQIMAYSPSEKKFLKCGPADLGCMAVYKSFKSKFGEKFKEDGKKGIYHNKTYLLKWKKTIDDESEPYFKHLLEVNKKNLNIVSCFHAVTALGHSLYPNLTPPKYVGEGWQAVSPLSNYYRICSKKFDWKSVDNAKKCVETLNASANRHPKAKSRLAVHCLRKFKNELSQRECKTIFHQVLVSPFGLTEDLRQFPNLKGTQCLHGMLSAHGESQSGKVEEGTR